MKFSLNKKILSLFISFTILLSFLSVVVSYRNFIHSMENSLSSTANTLAETCVLFLDNTKLQNYIQTNERDDYYYELWNRLYDFRNTNNNLTQLSIVWFDDEGCHYVVDTEICEDGAMLGDVAPLNTYQQQRKDALIAGDNIDYISYANQIIIYRPVYSSYNIPLGYVVIGMSIKEAERAQLNYLIQLVVIVAMLACIIAVFFIWLFRRIIVNPINLLTKATANYEEMFESTECSPLSGLKIKTGDEIEQLFHALKKMEADLLHSSNDLAVATWNSYHDSMTQLFNKRYLEECQGHFAGQKSLGVIYFDVDNLKKMNDICGHECGDEVITKTADFVRKYTREGGAGFRMGGDEFMLLVVNTSENEMEQLVTVMKADKDTTLSRPEQEVQCRIAIGHAFGAKNYKLETLMSEADANMFLDKKSHR